jgi:cytochrome bd-type quinol oxidase subunit 2
MSRCGKGWLWDKVSRRARLLDVVWSDVWAASAPRSSQIFLLVGVVIIVPIILSYTALSYWVFRGKVRHGDEGYH